MLAALDPLPWLADLLEMGGNVLLLILCIAVGIWALLTERLYVLLFVYPGARRQAQSAWAERRERTSWYAQQEKADLVATLRRLLMGSFPLIGTLIKICPLLGLLGTVLGMLEVFDALAATGTNNPRSMAAGVSKATISTLAGMVVAIGGLLTNTLIERRARAERERLDGYFESS